MRLFNLKTTTHIQQRSAPSIRPSWVRQNNWFLGALVMLIFSEERWEYDLQIRVETQNDLLVFSHVERKDMKSNKI